MTVTVDDLAKLLKFAATPADTDKLDRNLATARAVIWPGLIAVELPTPDQEQALDHAVLTVAQDLYRREESTGGIYQFGDGTDIPGAQYLPRDALRSVLPSLIAAGLYPAAVVA